MDVLPRITRQLFELFRAMSPVQRATFVTLPVLILGGLVWLVVSNQPQDFQAVSFGKAFPSEELAAAENALNRAGLLNYRREGRKLLALAAELDRYNAALVEFDAVPSDLGSQILKQFETLGPFSTDRHRQEMKDALLLLELRRMIKAVPDIEDARVAVANSTRRVGFGQKPRVTANVTVKPRAGKELSSRLVASLRQAVASMVPDLQPADVTVFDVARGQAYSGQQADDPLDGRLIQRVREFTHQYEQQIQKALNFIPNVSVTVNVDLDNLKSSVVRNERVRVNTEPAPNEFPSNNIQPIRHEEVASNRYSTAFRGPEASPADYSREVSEHELMAAMPRAVQVSVSIPRDYYRDLAARHKTDGESNKRRHNIDSIEEEILTKVERTVARLIPLGSPRDAVSVTTVDRLPAEATVPELTFADQLTVLAWRHGGSCALGLFVICALWMLSKLSTPSTAPAATIESDRVEHPAREMATPDPMEPIQQPFPQPVVTIAAHRVDDGPVPQSVIPEAVPEIFEQLAPKVVAPVVQERIAPKFDAGPFAFMIGRHPDDIRQLLVDEHSQTIAVIAAQLPPSVSAAVLAGFPPDIQADVLHRVAKLGPTDPEILADIAIGLKERLGRPPVRAGGISQAAAVLRESSRSTSRSMLLTLDDQDADLADELRQTLFSFDDLLKLDDDTLRTILEETGDHQWALALKASPVAVRKKVLGCLAAHVSRAFQDEMNSLGPVRLSEMTSVRQRIAESIHKLEEKGLIDLPIRQM